MGKKKRGSNRQNPGPSERTSQDQNFAQAVKTLFRIIQCIHHFAIANNQLNGTVTKSFEAKLSDLNKFVKPACPTASLAQQIDLINSRWLQDITESLVAHFRERIDNFKRQLSTFRLDLSDCEKAQTLAEKWARRNFRSKLKDCTLVEFRSICREWLSSNPNGRVTESSTPSSHLTNDSNQERSRPNSPATRMPNSRRSPSPSASSKQTPGTSASPDRSFVDVVINPGYVSPPRSPVRAPKKPIQRSFKPWVAPRTAHKPTWRIPAISTETVILGASNLSRITKSRLSHSSLSICSFPGAKFQHCYQLCQHVIPGADKVKNLVLSFGLNNRSDKVQATSLPKYRLMIREAQTAFPSAKIHVVEPNWAESLPDNEKNNLKHLVQGIRLQKLNVNLIPKLNESKFKIDPKDPYKIHWTNVTANHWLEHVLDNLN